MIIYFIYLTFCSFIDFDQSYPKKDKISREKLNKNECFAILIVYYTGIRNFDYSSDELLRNAHHHLLVKLPWKPNTDLHTTFLSKKYCSFSTSQLNSSSSNNYFIWIGLGGSIVSGNLRISGNNQSFCYRTFRILLSPTHFKINFIDKIY